MSVKTGIEWCDSTLSPIRVRVKPDAAAIAQAKGYASLVPIASKMADRVGQHCEHVSPGCEHCYAETNNHRCLPGNGTGLPYDRRSRDLVEAFVDEKILLEPLRWHAGIRDKGTGIRRPRRIFVENQSDLFGEWVSDGMIDRIFAVMALCPQQTFQVLTKRPQRMLEYLSAPVIDDGFGVRRTFADRITMIVGNEFPLGLERELKPAAWPLPNVWLGVTVENQPAADERIPLVLRTPAAVRFISAEPLLGPLSIERFLYRTCRKWESDPPDPQACDGDKCPGRRIDQVICGGESGPGARPMEAAWARSLRDQCAEARVPFFFKQWGEWGPNWLNDENGKVAGSEWMDKLGKKAAGRLLDDREWNEFPEGTPCP
jgi:protein gp37